MKYSEIIQAHFAAPKNVGVLPNATVVGEATNSSCLDTLSLYLQIDAGRIVAARYQVEGCVPSIALGSILTEYLIGQRVDELTNVTPADLEALAGGLPNTKKHAALLAHEALLDALHKFASQIR